MNMVSISKCNMSTCAYNMSGTCHTPGITVGPHAECNTYVHASSRGGFPEVQGGVGACMASSCTFNDKLECKAQKIDVAVDEKHADCKTFLERRIIYRANH
ncbi:MAG TPA: DUF1540 domain-containing protein [Dehalococcoidales bacterium]|nr:DUF1540 domain-containing protein [Dehalococcoidales bacterium]